MLILGGREWASTPDRYRQEWVRPALHGVQGNSRQYSTVHTGINLSLIGAIRQVQYPGKYRYGTVSQQSPLSSSLAAYFCS